MEEFEGPICKNKRRRRSLCSQWLRHGAKEEESVETLPIDEIFK